ncbi:hypothetical protein [Rubrivirga sp. IMCC45206]|uniref:hypothetical protein n=1 Tax=Rubrivirga sp. IMCC45206 TaxID=3391614 RepID=UPI00398FA186
MNASTPRAAWLGVAVVALLLAGCDAASPEAASADARASGAKATGSGHFVDTRVGLPEGDQYRTFSFNAQEARNGARGRWNLNARSFPVRLRGDVTCISVDGNQAWFAGPTTGSDDPAQVGVIRGFHVVDNGEGNGPPDQISFAVAPGDAQLWCDLMLDSAINEVENGNVQVH